MDNQTIPLRHTTPPRHLTAIASLAAILAVIIGTALFSLTTNALEYDVRLFSDVRYDDNANTAEDNGHDIQSTSGLSITGSHDTTQLQLSGDYRVGYTDYLEDTNDSRSELAGDSAIRAELLPSRAYWSVTHAISEQRRSRADIDTADNRERRQEFSTGPQVQFNVSKVDTLLLTASYGEVHFADLSDTGSDSPDSEIKSGSLNWQHTFSALTDLVTGYSYREVTRELAADDFDSEFENAYIGINRRLRELQYGIQVGASKSKSDSRSSDTSLFYQADLTKTSASSTFGLTASRQQTDSSTGLQSFSQLFDQFDELASLFDDAVSQGNFDRTSTVDVTSFEGRFLSSQFCQRCDYSLTYSYVDSDYSGSEIDDEEQRATIGFSHRLNRELRASLSGSWRETEFDNNTTQIETGGALTLSWTPNDRLSIYLTGGYEDREDDANSGYHNSFGGVGFSYTLFESRD